MCSTRMQLCDCVRTAVPVQSIIQCRRTNSYNYHIQSLNHVLQLFSATRSQIFSSPRSDRNNKATTSLAMATISSWISWLLAPAELRDACAVQFPVSQNGSAVGPWQLCCRALQLPPPPEEGCLAMSVGIGGDLAFETALAASGCHVHAFDPTVPLRTRHVTETDKPINHRIRFYYLGLGPDSGDLSQHEYRLPYGQLAPRMAPLRRLMDIATAGRTRTTVDVLKIDCEGCEWGVFADLARQHSNVLRSVRMLLLELHVTPALGLGDGSEGNTRGRGNPRASNASETLVGLLDFIVRDMGFRLYKRRLNPGYSDDRYHVADDLRAAGFPGRPCCVELHFVRPSDLHASAHGPAAKHARDHIIPPSEITESAVAAAAAKHPGKQEAISDGSSMCNFHASPDWRQYPELWPHGAPPLVVEGGARIAVNDGLYHNPRLNAKEEKISARLRAGRLLGPVQHPD